MLLRAAFAAVLVLALAAPAGAQVQLFPPGVELRRVDVPAPFEPRPIGPDHAPSCMPIYANETVATGFYVPAGAQVEIADDLHTTSEGRQALCAFDFAYYKPGLGTVDATVTFYDGTGVDEVPGPVMAGPFVLLGLPAGANAFHMEVPGGLVDEDVWMGVSFSDGETGLLTYGPPELGASHDLAWMNPPGQIGHYGGSPPADFFLGVYSSPSTAAAPVTWGRVRAIHR